MSLDIDAIVFDDWKVFLHEKAKKKKKKKKKIKLKQNKNIVKTKTQTKTIQSETKKYKKINKSTEKLKRIKKKSEMKMKSMENVTDFTHLKGCNLMYFQIHKRNTTYLRDTFQTLLQLFLSIIVGYGFIHEYEC